MENLLIQHIEQTPGVLGGKPRIAGHRVRVMDVVIWHERRGLSPEEIVGLFPGITLADVYAALAFYFDHRKEIESDLKQEAQTIKTVRRRYPPKVKAKLRE